MSDSGSLLFFSVALLLISPITTSAESGRTDQPVMAMHEDASFGTDAAEPTFALSDRSDLDHVAVLD